MYIVISYHSDKYVPIYYISNMHYCYILYDKTSHKTYVGYTTDPTRRLRQHQGIIKGGARYTSHKGIWDYLVIVASPEFTHNTALSFEWHVKHIKQYNIKGRIISLLQTILHNKKFDKHNYCVYISPIMEDMISSSLVINNLFDELIRSERLNIFYNNLKEFINDTYT
jgi:predicted GIY-YIG superfamily endonuclease